jgi:cytidylate kinase
MNGYKLNLSRFKGKIIAIDGPAGSGKSTTARILADRLGYLYLDTGAMYRALTHFALTNNVALSDGNKLAALSETLPIELVEMEGVTEVLINGQNVTSEIRSPEVTRGVSEVSAHAGVRKAMVEKQRSIGKNGSIVAEGRDTTTIVFPEADLKVFLEASIETRARRRLLELARSGISTSLEEQQDEIRRRDSYDSERKHSPLVRAKDAVVVDTSSLTIEEQVEQILTLVRTHIV